MGRWRVENALIIVIANHMKKCYLSWNKETVTDDVIFEHLYELSDGKINLLKSDEELSTSQNLIKVNKNNQIKHNSLQIRIRSRLIILIRIRISNKIKIKNNNKKIAKWELLKLKVVNR